MEKGYLDVENLHILVKECKPSLTWDGQEDTAQWQKRAKAKLSELIGLDEIDKRKTDLKMEIEYDRYSEDLGCREIRFLYETEKGVTVPCHLAIPNGADKPLPVVICLQGHSRGMHISLGRPKFAPDEASIASGDRDFVRRAVKEGCCAIALEQRCFGERSSKAESAIDCRFNATKALLIGRTIIGERVWDIMRCIDVIARDFAHVADPEKVICLGNSGGGTATIYASAIDERIKISVPSCAVCAYGDSIAAVPHCECNFVPNIAKYFDMGDICAMVAPRPLIVVNGKDDMDFPLYAAKACVEVGRRVYEAMGVSDEIVHVVGNEGHRFYADDAWPHINRAIANM